MTHLLVQSAERQKSTCQLASALSFRYAAAQARLAPQTRAQNSHHSLGHHHLIDFFIRELLAKVGHHVPQLRSTDEAVSITIENLEGLHELRDLFLSQLVSHWTVESCGRVER